MAFKYRGADRKVEDVVKRSKQSGGSYDSYLNPDCSFLKIREGDAAIRILPPTWEDVKKYGDGWELQIYLHRNVGPDNGTYLCLDKMKGETCPVCEARREATDEEEADALKPMWRAICWVIDRDNEKAGPQVMSLPVTLFRDINARSVDKKTNAVILIDDPEEGYDVLFNREGTDKRTKYSAVEIERDPSSVGEPKQQQRWLDYIDDHPLPEMLVFFEPEHIEKVLFGKAERRGRPEEEEETTTRSTRRGRREEPAEEEEESPRGGRSRRSAEPAEEEETAPRSRRGRAEPEEEAETERPSRTRSRGRSSGEEEEPEPEARSSRRRGREEPEEVERRRSRAEPEEEGEESEAVSPSRQARGKLERLKNRGR